MRVLLCLLLILPGWAPLMAAELAARDALTGAAVSASVSFEDGSAGERRFQLDGRQRRLEGISAPTLARVQAEGYRDMAIRITPDDLPTTLMLDPVDEPAALSELAARSAGDPAARWLQGWVRRVDDARPIANAVISCEGREVRSDSRGYFELQLPPQAASPPRRSSLSVDAEGIGHQLREGLRLGPGIQRLLLTLGPGEPARVVETIGALDRGNRPVTADGPVQANPLPRPETPAGPSLAPGLVPPASIRVGFADAACTQSCCTGACTHTCALSLETYVRRGLDNEWIASWNQQSLRAGSIAYRSYGAWRVDHPIRNNFDICSSACCQVNDGGTHSNTDNAIARTPGILLTGTGDAAFASEYSAENNSWDDPDDGLSCSNSDLSCGNGFVGSPSTGWPCLADAVAAGRGCFGHGRGMSQWGTQRWAIQASAPSWTWIVDHYYNANGAGTDLRTAVMTSPLSLTGITAQPASLEAGQSFLIGAMAGNAAGATHAHLLIGASLYRSGVGYIDDSGNDAPVVIEVGDHLIGRPFEIPVGTPAGSYDLLVSLYLDVDENGSISGNDLALALERLDAAVQVVVIPPFSGFVDGFEGDPP